MATATKKRPQALPVLEENIPGDLKQLDRWVVWRYTEEADSETGEVDWDKPPVNARTNGPAGSTNAKSWCPFAEAIAAYRKKTPRLDGVGVVLHRAKGEADK